MQIDGNLPHLSGVGSDARQVLAAHFLRDCDHIVEIGGHNRPICTFLTHTPDTVLSVDPKSAAYESRELNGKPCHVRHLPRKFQEVEFGYQPGTYGLVMLGYSLKPFGASDPLGHLLFSLIDNARMIVIDYTPGLKRAVSQIPAIIERPGLETVCKLEMRLYDPEITDTPFAERRFYVLKPVHQNS